jgi:hypothetical protein
VSPVELNHVAESYDRKKAWPSINRSILSGIWYLTERLQICRACDIQHNGCLHLYIHAALKRRCV